MLRSFAAARALRARVAPIVARHSVVAAAPRHIHSGPTSHSEYKPDTSKQRKVGSREIRFGGQAHNFPNFIHAWNRKKFYMTGYAGTALATAAALFLGPTSAAAWAVVVPVGLWWAVGLHDIQQEHHAVRRNFPVLGNVRYLLESIRPEIRQYFVEGDYEAVPFSRAQRSTVYQRAKDMGGTSPFGTRLNVYSEGYEWINHSLWPTTLKAEDARVTIGGPDCKHPYSASLLNISAMSYGALSSNAILALNSAAEHGGFYHNTGEGGVSEFHLAPGGDLVWNVGTGYFGCRAEDGGFDPDRFQRVAAEPSIKMIEIKLSQGAKPAHGGILPASKLTPTIAAARGVPLGKDCDSPPRHRAFDDAEGLMEFVAQLRELSDGKPVGFKLCVGDPVQVAALVQAMVKTGTTPDFITVDDANGGTGAAPPEFSDRVGMPGQEGLHVVGTMLRGAGLRDRVKIIASGKITNGFSIVRNLALGADLCNSARAMLLALGCIQALSCNTNRCPTGITTQDPELMKGLVVPDKATRVFRYHEKTVHTAIEILCAAGCRAPGDVKPTSLFRRVDGSKVQSLAEMYPVIPTGSLLDGSAPAKFQGMWEEGAKLLRGGERYDELRP